MARRQTKDPLAKPPAPVTGNSVSGAGYFIASRGPTYSFIFSVPLFLLYEYLSWIYTTPTGAIRNGADVLMKNFLAIFGIKSLTGFTMLLVVGAGIAVYREHEKNSVPVRKAWFALMLVESAAYAVMLGPVVIFLMSKARLLSISFGQEFTVMLGAGLYEELLFRVVLVSGLQWCVVSVYPRTRGFEAGVYSVVLSSLIFSGFHHVGSLGEPFTWAAFSFRAFAGGVLAVLYLVRGFGITAYSHAFYDLIILFSK